MLALLWFIWSHVRGWYWVTFRQVSYEERHKAYRAQLRRAALQVIRHRANSLATALAWSKHTRRAWRLLAQHAQLPVDVHRNQLRRSLLNWAAGFSQKELFEHLFECSCLPPGVQGTVTIYCSSVSGDNTDGLTWAKAKTTMTGALAACTDATFNFIYVDSAHAVNAGAAITYNIATSGSEVVVLSVDRNGSTTTGDNGLLAGASESVGAANSAFSILTTTQPGYIYFYGYTFNGGTNNNGTCDILVAGGSSRWPVEFVSCTFDVKSANAAATCAIGSIISGSNLSNRISFYSCTIKLANAAGAIGIQLQQATIDFTNLTIAFSGATKPTTCFGFGTTITANVTIRDSDLSGYNTSGGNLIAVAGFETGSFLLVNCKLDSTPGFVTGTWPVGNNSSITVVNCDDADTHNVFEFRNRLGTLTQSSSIYRDNGSQFDSAGISWQIVTTAACTEHEPFITPWVMQWNTGTSSTTFGLELIFDSATDLTDRTFWVEFDLLESASFPNGTLSSTRNARPFDGSGTNLTASTEAWTGAGGFSNSKKRAVSVTRTPAEKSLVRARVSVGVASWTGYLDPCITLAGAANNRQVRWTPNGAFVEPGAAGGTAGPKFGAAGNGPSFGGAA